MWAGVENKNEPFVGLLSLVETKNEPFVGLLSLVCLTIGKKANLDRPWLSNSLFGTILAE